MVFSYYAAINSYKKYGKKNNKNFVSYFIYKRKKEILRMKKKKIFVLDTNIFIHNPNCLEKFEDNEIIIPYVVIEELDGLKNTQGEVGYNARETMRKLARLREKGNIVSGVTLDNGGKVSIYVTKEEDMVGKIFGEQIEMPSGWKKDKADNQILYTTMQIISEAKPDEEVILISNDNNMLLKADCIDIRAQSYKNDRIENLDNVYKGRCIRHIKDKDFEEFISNKSLNVNESLFDDDEEKRPLIENEYVTLMNWQGGSKLTKFQKGNLIPLNFINAIPMGLSSRNSGQTFLKESLYESSDNIPLVICNGPAGTGKTLFAIACGLEQVIENKIYKRVLVCRPNVMMDEEIGFLPGTEQEKISPLLRGVYDNLEVIFGDEDDTLDQIQDKIKEIFQRGYITAQSIAYLRGRSITDTYIIIDECQNASPNQILSIITRAGEGSKIILLGDVNQIDNPRLDSRNNGLIYAIERMKNSELCSVITFEEKECVRSVLAKEASNRLKR